jgi:hypothetical protein
MNQMSTYADKLEELQRLKAEVRRLEHQAEIEAKRMQPLTEHDERVMYADQATFDEAYMGANRKAPPPLPYERPDQYKRRLASGLQSLSPRWAKADFDSMPNDAFAIAEAQVRADAIANGKTAGLQAREIRERVRTDHSGHRVVEFDGGLEAHFVRAFERPARRAILPTPEECTKKMQTAAMQRVEQIVRYGQRLTVSAPRAGF